MYITNYILDEGDSLVPLLPLLPLLLLLLLPGIVLAAFSGMDGGGSAWFNPWDEVRSSPTSTATATATILRKVRTYMRPYGARFFLFPLRSRNSMVGLRAFALRCWLFLIALPLRCLLCVELNNSV